MLIKNSNNFFFILGQSLTNFYCTTKVVATPIKNRICHAKYKNFLQFCQLLDIENGFWHKISEKAGK
jgi:hypothetical protein